MKRQTRDISQLKNWDLNPRGIHKDDFERLKKQIKKFGMYKPLLIAKDGTILGGNMRFRAYKELGIKEVWVSVVDAPTNKEKAEYALSDNDRLVGIAISNVLVKFAMTLISIPAIYATPGERL